MKNIIAKLLMAVALMALVTACSDSWLDLSNPNLETADTFWQTEEQFDEGLSAAYSTWRRPGYFSRWFQVHMVIRADEGWSESPNSEFQADANFLMTGYNYDDNEGLCLPWEAFYSSVYYANQVIDNVNDKCFDSDGNYKEGSILGEEDAMSIRGQAYFVRALAEWAIGCVYGRGPLNLSSTVYGSVVDQPELFKQAAADFETSAQTAPISWSASEKGRVTKGGALGMAAKMNMQIAGMYCHRPWATGASYDSNGNLLDNPSRLNGDLKQDKAVAREYWLKAKDQIEQLFNMGIYDLVPNWMDNFTESNENNEESIFEVQFKDGLINGNEVGNQRPKFLGLYLEDGSGAWNDASSRAWLLAEFNKEKDKDGNVDPRKFHTLFYYDENEPETATANYYGKTWIQWLDTDYPTRPYGEYSFPHECYWKKYTSVETDNLPEDYSSGANLRILRLADVYFMYAEIINELIENGGCDKTRADAVEYINKVRRRSNMSDLTTTNLPLGYYTYYSDTNTFEDGRTLQIFSSYDDLLECLKHERQVELCGECVRWLDLDRWGVLHDQTKVNELAQHDVDFLNYRVGYNHVWCIPDHEINLWEGESGITRLTQNPGY